MDNHHRFFVNNHERGNAKLTDVLVDINNTLSNLELTCGEGGGGGGSGSNGADGDSAFDIAVSNGFSGTESEWLASLVGEDGVDGVDGSDGVDGADGNDGVDGIDGIDGDHGIDGVDGTDGTNGVDGTDGTNGVDGADGADGGSTSSTIYIKANLPLNKPDGTTSLITDGTVSDTPCVCYYYDGVWYRINDNSPILDNFNSVILTFKTGQNNNDDLSSTYGSAISTTSTSAIVNGTGCPFIDLEWTTVNGLTADVWEIHQSNNFISAFGSSNLPVVQMDLDPDNGVIPPNPLIIFTTTSSVQVRIVGFRIGNLLSMASGDEGAWVINIYENDATGNKVYTQTTNVLGAGDFQDIAINYVGETGKNYALEFDNQGKGHYWTGINNLTYEQHINQIPTGDKFVEWGGITNFKIAVVADPQYADIPPNSRGGGKNPEQGVSRLNNAVTKFNQRTLDWGMIMGDIIDNDDIYYNYYPSTTNHHTIPGTGARWSNADDLLTAWSALTIPKRLLLGNHDYYVAGEDLDGVAKPQSVYRKFGTGTVNGFPTHNGTTVGYYHHLYNGFRFVVLEGDNSYNNYKIGTTEHTNALAYYNDLPSSTAKWYNAGISITQRKWMMDILDTSYASNEPVIVMCHYPIASLFNGGELLDIIGGYSNVVMWLNGHIHNGSYAKINSIHHLGLEGMMENADAWYQMDFTSSLITVYEADDITTPKYELPIARTSSISISTPTGLTKTNGTLGWNTEPTGVSNIIIERRSCPTAVYELPSTADTLAYEVIATISITSSIRSYTDSNYSTYNKYRIRFINGIQTSYYAMY